MINLHQAREVAFAVRPQSKHTEIVTGDLQQAVDKATLEKVNERDA